MNIYMGREIADVDIKDDNVEVSDELLDYVCKIREQVEIDTSRLHEINPYEDVVLMKEDLLQIIEICNYLCSIPLMNDFTEPEEGKQMLKDLSSIAQNAMLRGMNLICIGD